VPDHDATPLVVNGSSLFLNYNRPVTVTDLSYQVQWADNIDSSDWSNAGVIQQIIGDDGSRRTIRAVIPRGATGRRFVRLKVTE
jgi:hypothetical protein